MLLFNHFSGQCSNWFNCMCPFLSRGSRMCRFPVEFGWIVLWNIVYHPFLSHNILTYMWLWRDGPSIYNYWFNISIWNMVDCREVILPYRSTVNVYLVKQWFVWPPNNGDYFNIEQPFICIQHGPRSSRTMNILKFSLMWHNHYGFRVWCRLLFIKIRQTKTMRMFYGMMFTCNETIQYVNDSNNQTTLMMFVSIRVYAMFMRNDINVWNPYYRRYINKLEILFLLKKSMVINSAYFLLQYIFYLWWCQISISLWVYRLLSHLPFDLRHSWLNDCNGIYDIYRNIENNVCTRETKNFSAHEMVIVVFISRVAQQRGK